MPSTAAKPATAFKSLPNAAQRWYYNRGRTCAVGALLCNTTGGKRGEPRHPAHLLAPTSTASASQTHHK